MATAAISAAYALTCNVTETVGTTPAATDANGQVVHNQFSASGTLTSSTTVPATKVAAFDKALVAGVGSIDLTALTGTNGGSVNGTGLKVQLLLINAASSNGAAVKVDVGSSNGYQLAGAGWEITLSPGQRVLIFGNDAAPDIGASAKIFDLTGTGTDALEVLVVMG